MKQSKATKKKTNKTKWVALITVLVLLPYIVFVFDKIRTNKILEEAARAAFIVVDKESMTLKVYNYNGDSIFGSGISCGKNYGNKRVIGDMKTPEGVFHVCDIQDASDWDHDFKDGKGRIQGAYGPVFIRLDVPGHKGIGIHGTHKPESIDTRDTEGCIRLENSEVIKLKELVYYGMVVVIIPSVQDAEATKLQIKEEKSKKQNEGKVSELRNDN
jgi:lipoprotein-anchoring transpeptidase ErfK/SrfK